MNQAAIEEIARLIVASQRVVALTGAGISTPSGVPDFRSPASGLWQNVNAEEVASLGAFRRNPAAFYDWLRPLARQILLAQPNPAHRALAALERVGRLRTVITQNIDGLHQKAGSRRVLELHGHLRQATCLRCHQSTPTAAFMDAYVTAGRVPACLQCGGVLKPDVILFGELLPVAVLTEAEREAESCDLMWVVGSSLTVAPASLLPMEAVKNGAPLVIVNRTPTDLDRRATVVLRGDAAEVLPAVVEACGIGTAAGEVGREPGRG